MRIPLIIITVIRIGLISIIFVIILNIIDLCQLFCIKPFKTSVRFIFIYFILFSVLQYKKHYIRNIISFERLISPLAVVFLYFVNTMEPFCWCGFIHIHTLLLECSYTSLIPWNHLAIVFLYFFNTMEPFCWCGFIHIHTLLL